MRTTMHNGRAKNGRGYGTKHNDRNFDTDKADNIDAERIKDNVYLNCYGDNSLTFEEAELKFYNEKFGKMLEKINENYIKNRHPERVKTMDEWKRVRQNAPEESILQIGKTEEHVSRQELIACYNDYNKWLQEWNKQHGNPFTTLNTALHCDEAVDHIQSRRVWHYLDENNELRIGQEKALKAAGVELPDPEKPESRRNNRKVTFDKMCRERWLDICHEHGIEVEREPVPNGRHNMEKEEMIRNKYETMLQEASVAEIRRDKAIEEADKAVTAKTEAETNLEALKEEILAEDKVLNSLVEEHNEKVAAFNSLVDKHNQLLDDTEALEKDKQELMQIKGRIAFVDEIEIEKPMFKKGKVLVDEKKLQELMDGTKKGSAFEHEASRVKNQLGYVTAERDRLKERVEVMAKENSNMRTELKELRPMKEFMENNNLMSRFQAWIRELQERRREKQRQSPERSR